METNENENMAVQILCDVAKTVLRGNYIERHLPQEARKVSNTQPTFHLKEIEKEQQIKLKARIRREIMKIRAETDDIETTTTITNIEQINETKSSSLEKLTKFVNPPARLIKKKRERKNGPNT